MEMDGKYVTRAKLAIYTLQCELMASRLLETPMGIEE